MGEDGKMRPILLGVIAAFFFAFTFVLNRAMELSGGSWIWSASLRYWFMVPFLFLIVGLRRNVKPLFAHMRAHPLPWLGWSMVGFGLFYAPMCFAAAYGPGWLIAGTWQVTIISGTLLAPFFWEEVQTPTGVRKVRQTIPWLALGVSMLIVVGIALMQLEHARQLSLTEIVGGILPVLVASFAYPLGNRKMMEVCEGKLDAYQRVLGMTLASLPFWLALSIYGGLTVGAPSESQLFQSLLVALCSGVVATVLFFQATDMVKGDMQQLAAVEATQSAEVLFAVLMEVVWLQAELPSLWSWAGMGLVVIGMIFHSYLSHRKHAPRPSAKPEL
jgi:drug/metabolite transporter (DMT)-like permease